MNLNIRKKYLGFFESKGHKIMPSSSLIPDNDPSVLLTTAGMQQFKPYYLGTETPAHKRVTTLQKCFRTSDIESVGYTNQHLTFFEMLGNFSFDDYFKKETIDFAMEFILEVLKIPIEKLRIGVFAGDKEIPPDDEAVKLWKSYGIKEKDIYRYGREDNFWGPAGDTGPCGPSTEIYYDYGKEFGCDKKDCSPSCDCDRYLEIWNLVFTQYNFDGKDYHELPNKNIDTGMGVERIEAVLENTVSVFRTGLFKKIISTIEELSGKRFDGKDPQIDKSIRIVADHSRAIFFLTTDGVVPSNEGRGYILRRIIRRAIRYAKLIGIEDYFLTKIGEVVIDEYKDTYEDILAKKKLSFEIIKKEESRFIKTLKTGSKLLDDDIKELNNKKKKQYDAKKAFRLYETYGFPVELTSEILNEKGIYLDIKKFDYHMKKHAEISKSKKGFDKKIENTIDVLKGLKSDTKTEFLGYELDNTESIITSILRYDDGNTESQRKLKEKDKGALILDKTVFFAEGGGQVGDKGTISYGDNVFKVEKTREPIEGIIIHEGRVQKGGFTKNDSVEALVDNKFRKDIRKNHTATHLIHWALRSVFGEKVTQAGSMVSDKRLRFDYRIGLRPSLKDIEKIEYMINNNILNNDYVRCFETTMVYAQEIGAISLFGEKYGDFVRVVEIDNYSRELCGGLHVRTTGEIGILKIISDTNIGANTRRIEALTGSAAYKYLVEKEKTVISIAKKLEVNEDSVEEKVDEIRSKLKKLEEEAGSAKKDRILDMMVDNLVKGKINTLRFDFSSEIEEASLSPKEAGDLGDIILEKTGNNKTILVLGLLNKGKPIIIMQSSKDLTDKGLDCSKVAKDIGIILKGGGGGKKGFAQVGGSDKSMLAKAIDSAMERLVSQIDQGE